MHVSRFLATFVLSSSLTLATSQTGSDSCATPDPLVGQGSFAFDNSAATTGLEGQSEPICYLLFPGSITRDVWFDWTADVTGVAQVSTCTVSFDSKIAAYPGGGCPTQASALACDDQGCGNQALIHFPVTNGTLYTLQVGTYLDTPGGAGNLEISITPSVSNDDCNSSLPIAGQGSFAFDQTFASAGVEGQAEPLCYAAGSTGTVSSDIWYSWTSDATGLARVSTCNSGGDTKLAAYPGAGCPTDGTALACNDDFCAFQSEISFPVLFGATYTLQLGTFPGTPGGIGTFEVVVQGVSEPGAAFCFCNAGNSACGNTGAAGHGCANGTDASGARLIGVGTAALGADSLLLGVSGLPAGQPGLFFQGDSTVGGGVGMVFGDGLRCAGTNVVRLGVVIADASGRADTGGLTLPISVQGGVQAGDLKHYQLWYRDPVGSPCGGLFNLTNGYSISW